MIIMTVCEDIDAKKDEIATKVRWLQRLSAPRLAGDDLWVAGDADYTDFKSICDVQSNLLTTLATELQALCAQ